MEKEEKKEARLENEQQIEEELARQVSLTNNENEQGQGVPWG